MFTAQLSECRGCGAKIECRDRCLSCGARWPHLPRERIRVHNCAACLLFLLLVVATVAGTWAAAQI